MAKGLTVQSVERLKPDPTKRREIPDSLLPGLYFVIQPSGARSWCVRYRHGGKPRKLTLGPFPALDLATARARAREALQDVARGGDPAAAKMEARRSAGEEKPDRDTVSAVVERFLERHTRARNKKRTIEEVERTFKLHVLPVWGERRIQDITRRDVIELLDGLVDRGTPVAANRTLAHVRKLFNWALDRSIIDASPCVRIQAPAAEKSRDRVLSDDELRLVWKAAERMGWPFGRFVQALVLTAQRRDEVAGLRWAEIKEGGTLWTIPSQRTKNGSAHDVPLSDAAQAILTEAPRLAGSALVFSTTGATPISGYSGGKRRLDAIMLAIARDEALARGDDPAAVKLEPWRLHDLRRTAASGLAWLKILPHVIEAVLNHRSGQISGVAAVYNKWNYLPEKRKALEAWAQHIETLVSGETTSNVVSLRTENISVHEAGRR
jgi:integrase